MSYGYAAFSHFRIAKWIREGGGSCAETLFPSIREGILLLDLVLVRLLPLDLPFPRRGLAVLAFLEDFFLSGGHEINPLDYAKTTCLAQFRGSVHERLRQSLEGSARLLLSGFCRTFLSAGIRRYRLGTGMGVVGQGAPADRPGGRNRAETRRQAAQGLAQQRPGTVGIGACRGAGVRGGKVYLADVCLQLPDLRQV